MGVRWDVDPGGKDSVSGEWKGMCQGTFELEGGGGGGRYTMFYATRIFIPFAQC
jgi:hypothetical protein